MAVPRSRRPRVSGRRRRPRSRPRGRPPRGRVVRRERRARSRRVGSPEASARVVSSTTSYSRPASRKPRFRTKSRDPSSSSRTRPHSDSRPSLRACSERRLVDPCSDALAAVLGQDAHHRVQAALDRRGAPDAAAERLVAGEREQERAFGVRRDEVRDLVDVEDVAGNRASGSSAHCSYCRSVEGVSKLSSTAEPYAGRMAAPVRPDDELDLRIESLAYGGNGVARLNGFVVFVRRGLPGDVVRARVTKVKRNHAEALALEVVEAGSAAGRRALRALPGLRRLPVPGSRVRGAARGEGGAGRRGAAPDRATSTTRRSSRSSRPSRSSTTGTSSSTRSRRRRTAPRSASTGPAAGTRCSTSDKCWLTTDLGNAIREAVRDWARAQRLEAYDQAEHTGFLRHLVVREGRNTGQALVQLVTAPGQARRGQLRRRARALPGGAVDPLVGQRHGPPR